MTTMTLAHRRSSDRTYRVLQHQIDQDFDLVDFHEYALRKGNISVFVYKDQEISSTLIPEIQNEKVGCISGQLTSVRRTEDALTVTFKSIVVEDLEVEKLLSVIALMWARFPDRKPKVHMGKNKVSFVWDEKPFVRK